MASDLTLLRLEQPAPAPVEKRDLPVAAKRNFAAAQLNRFTADWATSFLSRDQKLTIDLRKLRARARELADNDPTAARFLSLCVTNIIGPKGIQLQAKVKNVRGGALASDVNQQIESEWKQWCKRGNCTVDGTMSFAELERLFIRTAAMDGEFIALMNVADNPWGFALQVLDVDQLDTTYSQMGNGYNSAEVRMGVELNRLRRPMAYWLWSQHPNEWGGSDRARVRIGAESVIHSYLPDSARQTRGVPWMAPAMYFMNMLKGYMEAEVTAARVGACQSFVIETPEDGIADDDLDGINEDGTQKLEMTPGGGLRLAAGESAVMLKPEHPTSAFSPFVKECKRNISTALQVSYTSLSDDLSEINFSSIRAGLIAERDMWKVRQQWTIEQFHKRVFRAWLSAAVLAGRINLSVRDEETVLDQMVWHARGFDWVDPLKDQQSASMGVQNGFTTLTRVLAERGYDLEETLAELAEEKKLIAKYGLTLGTDDVGKADTATDDTLAEGSSAEEKPKGTGPASK